MRETLGKNLLEEQEKGAGQTNGGV